MLSLQERRRLLRTARLAVRSALLGEPFAPPTSATEGLLERRGVFVSIHTGGELRGCTGYIRSGLPLIETVPRCAVSAATADPRFAPFTKDELPHTTFEISVLTPPAPTASPMELEIGRHGIIISRGLQKGLLLPQVATQNGFTPEAFLNAGCLKAGLPAGSWKEPDVDVELFTADVFSEADDDS